MRQRHHGNDQHDEPSDDIRGICKNCAQLFTIDAGEAAWFRVRNWHLPRRCPRCRAARRAEAQAAAGTTSAAGPQGEGR